MSDEEEKQSEKKKLGKLDQAKGVFGKDNFSVAIRNGSKKTLVDKAKSIKFIFPEEGSEFGSTLEDMTTFICLDDNKREDELTGEQAELKLHVEKKAVDVKSVESTNGYIEDLKEENEGLLETVKHNNLNIVQATEENKKKRKDIKRETEIIQAAAPAVHFFEFTDENRDHFNFAARGPIKEHRFTLGLETVEDVNTKVVEANAIETVHTLLTSGVQYNKEHTTFVTIPLKEVHQWGIGKIREKVIELLRIGKDKRKSRGRIVQTIERRRNASVEKKRKKGLANHLLYEMRMRPA